MRATYPAPDLNIHHKLVVGEGPSDFKFMKAFCAANAISGFEHAFTGMASHTYEY